MPCTSMHSDTMYVVSMCGCTFGRAVHMRSDAVSDISVHMDSKSGSIWTPDLRNLQKPVGSWNPGFRRNLDFSRKVEISAKSWIFWIRQDFGISAGFRDFGTLAPESRFWLQRSEILSGQDSGPEVRIDRSRSDLPIWTSGPEIASGPEILTSQVYL